MPGVSVVVCCYNSARRLAETLRHLAAQRVPTEFHWEVIIVDNASTDGTGDAARKEWAKYSLPISFRVLREEMPGLSHARARGVAEAQYEYIIFCDDDNWLDESYVATAAELMQRYPEAGAIGGRAFAAFEGRAPEWFERFERHFAVGAQGSSEDVIEDLGNKQRYVFGAAAVLRKEALKRLQSFGHKLICSDRSGKSLLSGGDNELCYCLLLLGYKILYSGALRFHHFMPAGRLTVPYLLQLNYGAGYSQAMLMSYAPFLSFVPEEKITWSRQLIINILGWFRAGVLDRFFRRRSSLDCRVSARKRLGAIVAVWKERTRIAQQIQNNRRLTQEVSALK